MDHIRLVSMLVAAASGCAVIRVGRKMAFDGVGLDDGGGYPALLLVAVMINLCAVTVALA